jgi:Na+-transporting NADH:ubiquinone oxidoreductase subunit NqrF
MKKLLFIGLALISLSACKKSDNSSNGTTPTSKSYLKMKVDGVLVELNSSISTGATMMSDIQQMGISFNDGNTADLRSASFVMDNIDVNTPQTYTMKANGYNYFNYVKSQTDKDNNSYTVFDNYGHKGSATITVTKIKDLGGNRKVMNGTFTATMYNKNGASISITEGEFFDARTN